MFSVWNIKRFVAGIGFVSRYCTAAKCPELKLQYRVIPEDCYNAVMKHLRQNYFVDEPISKSVRLYKYGTTHKEVEKLCLQVLKKNLSIMATNERDELAGVILNSPLTRDDFKKAKWELESNRDETFKKILNFFYSFNLKTDIFNYFKVNKIFNANIVSVDGNFRGKGVSKSLLKYSEELAKENGFEIMKAEATGIFSQKIFKIAGFKLFQEQFYNRYVDEHDEPILPVELPDTKMQLLYKLIK
uniref:aralkylamine N-acetyltransferase n=1 Tax=Glossina palpalis gambiensis TaxID=67801 RepID=A0A1B0AXY8_9MUSC